MAPKQKTFELIPDLPGLGQAQQLQQQQQSAATAAAVQSRPPMTSKQAKKLYRQKSKGPKLSKAEQRRIDLMEQDRIRKEFEKEKAQARARTARDKKKAKEDKERDEKRRKGLPLVDVHPSQDVISRFINRLGSGARNNIRLDAVQEADSESATEADSDLDVQNEPCEEPKVYHAHDHNGKAPGKENEDPTDAVGDSAARAPKRRKLGQPGRNLLDRMIHIPSQPSVAAVARVAQEMEKESWSRPSSVDTDDPDTETMLEDQLIADVELASSKSATRSSPNRQSPAKEHVLSRVQAPSHAPLPPRAPPPPPPPPHPPSRAQPPQPQKMQARQLPAGARNPLGHVAQAGARPTENAFKKPAPPFVPLGKQGHAMKCAGAAKSPAPPKFKPASGPAIPRSGMPRFLPKPTKAAPVPGPVQASPTYAGSRRPAIKTADAFPTSTQLLVMNHVDELFPSPSQEARELYEDQQPPKTAKLPSGQPSLADKPKLFTDERNEYQDGRLSSIAPIQPMPPSRGQASGNVPPEFPFLATQDLILSSQDIAEIDTPSKVPPEPVSRTLKVTNHGNTLPSLPGNLTLPSDERKQVTSGAQTSCPVRPPSAGAVNVDLHCSPPLPTSKPGPGPHGTPLVRAVEEVTRCPTQALLRPRSQGIRASRNGCSPSRPTSQLSSLSPQNRVSIHDTVGQCQSNDGFDRRPPGKHSRANSPSSCAPNGCAEPPVSLPKKRMFSSSGPGAEVLVAMERSYRESLAEERRRKEELRAQERKAAAEKLAQQDLAEISEDDLLDDEIEFGSIQADDSGKLLNAVRSSGKSPATSRPRSPVGMGTHAESHAPGRATEGRAELMASQETDYGDFDLEAEEELDILADITWADDDLSDI